MGNTFYTDPAEVPAPAQETGTELVVVSAPLPAKDGCTILTRAKAFVVTAGVLATLEHTFRTRDGLPVDLSGVTNVSESASFGASDSAAAADPSILLRVAEFTGGDACRYTELAGTVADAAAGTVRAQLPGSIAKAPGIYTLDWGLKRNGDLVQVSTAILSVEPSLFRDGDASGPPTLTELRMLLMDSSAADNYLLADVEFADDQLLLAIAKPIAYFNETNPPLSVRFDTRTFPWKEHWTHGILANLYTIAAANYRRNRLAINSGNTTVDDKAKETEYLRAARMHDEQWKAFVLARKVQLNAEAGFATFGSSYV